MYAITFRIIDHYDDRQSPRERTCIDVVDKDDAVTQFITDMSGYNYEIISIEHVTYGNNKP